MDGQAAHQCYEGQEGVQYYVPPSQPSGFPQIPLEYGAAPLFSPMTYPILPAPPAMGLDPANSQVMNGPLLAGGLPVLGHQPGPASFGQVNQPTPATVYHAPMAVAQGEVAFDPSTPPPFADRAQMQTPRRHGVLKVTNVSLSCASTCTPHSGSVIFGMFVCLTVPDNEIHLPVDLDLIELRSAGSKIL